MLQFQINKFTQESSTLFLEKNQFSTPFQSIDFYEFINNNKNQQAFIYSYSNDKQTLASCLVTLQKESGIKGFFSKRAIIYGGPLLSDDNVINKQFLTLLTNELKNKVIYIETRNFIDYAGQKSVFNSLNWEYLPYLNFQLEFKDATLDELIAAMKYNRRREIKQSLNENAIYSEAQNEDDINKLYLILQELYATRVNVPLPPVAYFINLFHSKLGKVFVVKHNGIIIGGAFCIFKENQFIYTLYYCGIRDYHKKIFPTHLAIIAAMEFGINNKLKGIDFMGAGKVGEEYGVRKYKSEFGGQLVEHGRFLKITNPFLYNLGKLALNQLKRFKK